MLMAFKVKMSKIFLYFTLKLIKFNNLLTLLPLTLSQRPNLFTIFTYKIPSPSLRSLKFRLPNLNRNLSCMNLNISMRNRLILLLKLQQNHQQLRFNFFKFLYNSSPNSFALQLFTTSQFIVLFCPPSYLFRCYIILVSQ